MAKQLNAENIRKQAKALDDAIEKRDIEAVVSYFSDACEVVLLGMTLKGKAGLRRAINWMFGYLKEIKLTPVTIMVEGPTFFEEYEVKAKVRGDRQLQVRQAEVLIYDDAYKVTSLRLYFDRLELAAAYAANPLEKAMIRLITRASVKGLA